MGKKCGDAEAGDELRNGFMRRECSFLILKILADDSSPMIVIFTINI